MALFAGRSDVYGTDAGPVTHAEPTVMTYADHLSGEAGIGIFPMLDDNTVCFAAIDLDEPNFELARTMQKLIPGQSWIERSRSGNAHVWVFFDYPCPAWAARTILRGATESVGRPDVEIFPKQDGLRKGGVGNYINLPYFGDTRPMIPGGDPGYAPVVDWDLAFADWTKRGIAQVTATARRQDPEAWEKRARSLGGKPPEERERSSDWGTAPRLHQCAVRIIRDRETNPITPGHRHQVLFHLACQLLNYRDFDEDEAREYLDMVNDAATKPLGQVEVDRLFNNAIDGQFTSTGCDDPVMAPYVDPECKIAHG